MDADRRAQELRERVDTALGMINAAGSFPDDLDHVVWSYTDAVWDLLLWVDRHGLDRETYGLTRREHEREH